MGTTNRYFSTTGNGAADGTSWADRAALIATGSLSDIIKNFDFAGGSNSLVCHIGPGTYTLTTGLSSGFLTAGPASVSNPLTLVGCDSSGNDLTPPDPDWTADMPSWDASGLPVLETTTNIATIDGTSLWLTLRLIKFTASGRNGAVVVLPNTCVMDWCSVLNSTSNAAAIGVSGNALSNCLVECSGTSFDAIVQQSGTGIVGVGYTNTRVKGNASASSGDRHGLETGTSGVSGPTISHCCVFDAPGTGIKVITSSTSSAARIINNTIDSCGIGIGASTTASPVMVATILNNCITNSGTYAINGGAESVVLLNNRMRDSGTANTTSLGDAPELGSYTTDAADSDDYNDATSNDFRIKSTAGFAGRRIGVSQMPASGSGLAASLCRPRFVVT